MENKIKGVIAAFYHADGSVDSETGEAEIRRLRETVPAVSVNRNWLIDMHRFAKANNLKVRFRRIDRDMRWEKS